MDKSDQLYKEIKLAEYELYCEKDNRRKIGGNEMKKNINFEQEEMENAGCNNGNYPAWTGVTEDGKKIGGISCRCCAGCSNTDRFKVIGEDIYLIKG